MNLRSLLAVILLAATLGCVSIKQEYPEKRAYVLHINPPQEPIAAAPLAPALEVRTFDISARYEPGQLVYQRTDHQYISDFYNIFFAKPQNMITESARNWLQKSGLFQLVLTPTTQALPSHILEGRIVRLHGDFRNLQNPKAIIEIQFLVYKVQGGTPAVLFQKNFHAEIPLESTQPEALVAGLEKGLDRILVQLTREIQSQLAHA